MNVRSLPAYAACYLAPAGLATFAALTHDQVNLTGYIYMLIFLGAPLAIMAINSWIIGRENYRKIFIWIAVGHTAAWVLTQALNALIQIGELYNLLVIPAICATGIALLPLSLYARFKRPAVDIA